MNTHVHDARLASIIGRWTPMYDALQQQQNPNASSLFNPYFISSHCISQEGPLYVLKHVGIRITTKRHPHLVLTTLCPNRAVHENLNVDTVESQSY